MARSSLRRRFSPGRELTRSARPWRITLKKAFDATKGGFGPWVLQRVNGPTPETHTTAISRELLDQTVEGITRVPSSFRLHPKLEGFVKKRLDALSKDTPFDWAYAEAIAFGSLVLQGTPVRLSGQDCGRGTFSQRHLVFYDFENGEPYTPLQHLADSQATFNVLDSSLSEFGVLGFEYGYSA